MEITRITNKNRAVSSSLALLSLMTILIALTAAALAQTASHDGSTTAKSASIDTALIGEQPAFLSSPPERITVNAPDAQLHLISAHDLMLTRLGEGDNKRIYRNLDRVRRSIASNRPLEALLQSPEAGERLRAALQNTILYIGVPGYGENGYNDFNSLSLPGNRKNGAANGKFLNIFNRRPAADTPIKNVPKVNTAPDPSKAVTKPNPNLGFLSDVQPQKSAAQVSGAGSSPKDGMGRKAAPLRDLAAFISMSSDNRQAALYVFGSIPRNADADMPFNFTVEAKRYGPAHGAAAVDYNAPAEINTLLDKQTLGGSSPSLEDGSGYFCYIYPLAFPDSGGQFNILISYWMNPSQVLTHGIALAKRSTSSRSHTPNETDLITIPMTRIQYFQKDFRYNLVKATNIGEQFNLYNMRRKK